MPVFNGEEFLINSLQSILNQTYKKWELLIGLNGVSKPKLKEIEKNIEEISKNDSRVKVSFLEEASKTKTLNSLVSLSKFENICLIDVDDGWHPEKLERQINFMKIYDVVGTGGQYFGEKSGYIDNFLGILNSKMFIFQNPLICSSVMLKKELAHWEETWEGLDDYRLWVKLSFENKKMYNVAEHLVFHRIHSSSFFNNKNSDDSSKFIESLPVLLREEWEELTEKLFEKKWDL